MMNHSILVFSLLLFAVLTPVYAQTAEHIVINEVEINPPGDDSDNSVSEWIEFYNPTDSDVDMSHWVMASGILGKTIPVPLGTVIGPGKFLTYSSPDIWFIDIGDSVELRDENNTTIDKTHTLSDMQDDLFSWQRIYDGYDSDGSDDWKFATATAGSSNGKLIDTVESQDITISASTDKPTYVFGETAIITGSVSEQKYIYKPLYQPEQILITITGPDFEKIIKMYPDNDLNYDTKLRLHKVLGIGEGIFDVSVRYAGATTNTSFSVGLETISEEIKQDAKFGIAIDKMQYIPGQTVLITGSTTEIIPLSGITFDVTDPGGNTDSAGTAFPIDGKFSISVFLSNIDPVLGTYAITARYSDLSASASFELVQDLKEDTPISLQADKQAYGLGDTVEISGRLNYVWISTLDLEIVQTKHSSIGDSTSYTGFKISHSVSILGDGSFSYSFTIPENPDRLGDYKITVSKDIGYATVIIHAVDDPQDFVASTDPITVMTDKDVYKFGQTVTVGGFVIDPYSNSSYGISSPVKVTIYGKDGTPFEAIGLTDKLPSMVDGISIIRDLDVNYDLNAVLETSGRYSVDFVVTPNIFETGEYVVKAKHLSDMATTKFSIIDSAISKDGPMISIDKEVYGLGQTVHLTGTLPPIVYTSAHISVIRPDGTRTDSGTVIDSQRFSWDWEVPVYEKPQKLKDSDGDSNYGIYKINVRVASESLDILFKVSPDPENDTLSAIPLFVSTEKSLYKVGEQLIVTGNVIPREQGDEGLVIADRIRLQVLDGEPPHRLVHNSMESYALPDHGGEFSSSFKLPATVFSEGNYIVRAYYLNDRVDSQFSVASDFAVGGDANLTLLLYTDKSEYYPGDTVVVSGQPSKLVYLDGFKVSVLQQTINEINCGSFYCGKDTGPETIITPSPSGSFTHQYVIPDIPEAVGSYQVTVDAGFEIDTIAFDVIERKQIPKPGTVIERENRIAETIISIVTAEKTTGNWTLAPRAILGSMITSARGDESVVNLKVSTAAGTCIIGPDADCLVRESTRTPGKIYKAVDADGINLNVRYSGPDVRLEKFIIIPVSSDVFLPDASWTVEVIKDDQASRFYYKVTYKTLE